jgi:hypothetical protein
MPMAPPTFLVRAERVDAAAFGIHMTRLFG